MSLTFDELYLMLSSEEPDYPAISLLLDASSAPHLKRMAEDDNVMLATKAVYAASLLPGGESEQIVEKASVSPVPQMRIASASALVNLPAASRNKLAARLLDDSDLGVEKLTIRSLSGQIPPAIRQRLDRLADGGDPVIRQLSKDKLNQIN